MKYLYCTIVLVLFYPALFAQNNYTEIFGTIDGEVHSRIYLYFEDYKKHDSISAPVTNGKFYFKINRPGPVLIKLFLWRNSLLHDIYIEGRRMEIHCTNAIKLQNERDTFNQFIITQVIGSPTEDLKRSFKSRQDQLVNSGLPEKEINEKYFQQLHDFVQSNPSSKVSAWLIGQGRLLTRNQTDSLNKKLSPMLANTYEKKAIEKRIDFLTKNESVHFGQEFKKFSFVNKDGQTLHADDYRGKYLLIILWASWCKPCRHEHPAINEYYDKKRHPNLEILGISCDKDSAKWVNAVKDDQLTWPQAWDAHDTIGDAYGIGFIPFKMLLDKEGKIIGWNCSLKEVATLISNKEEATTAKGR